VLGKPKPHAHHSGRVIGGALEQARLDSLAVLENGNIAAATLDTGQDHRVLARRGSRARGQDAGRLSDQHLLR
jgi:beta-lactamase superfamily II metal-dependent hydrolase